MWIRESASGTSDIVREPDRQAAAQRAELAAAACSVDSCTPTNTWFNIRSPDFKVNQPSGHPRSGMPLGSGRPTGRRSLSHPGRGSGYWVTVRRPVWVLAPPTETTAGCTPKGAAAGTVKLTCEMPTRPMGTPAKETVAAKPPTVTVTGSFGRGSLAVVAPEGGLAPVIRNVVVSPSPVM